MTDDGPPSLLDNGTYPMYINGEEYIGDASATPDLDSKCLVCSTIYSEYSGKMEEHVEEIIQLNETFDHTLGPNCAIRERCEKDPFAPSIEEIAEAMDDNEE